MNIAIIYGGISVEHDVSILTALHMAKNVPDHLRVELVYITRGGQMVTSHAGGVLNNLDEYRESPRAPRCMFSNGALYKFTKLGVRRVCKIDAVLNCCHGGAGEDGRLAAMFDVLGIPVTGCPMISAANLQSKSRTREILTQKGFAQPHFLVLKTCDFDIKKCDLAHINTLFLHGKSTKNGDEKTNLLRYPCIIKPDNLGSSIGITIAHNDGELRDGLELAFTLDDAAVVEEFIENADEINCAVFKYNGRILTSGLEQISKSKELFDFDTKYLDTQSGFVKKRAGETAAEKPIEFEKEIKELAVRAYEIFGCEGVVRADFLVKTSRVILNEINTNPGFMAYHLWQKVGLGFATLIEMAAETAIKNRKNRRNVYFSSEILQKNRNLI
jgi:D-alanine-D-alanine ligase